jgi:hypothetical protein
MGNTSSNLPVFRLNCKQDYIAELIRLPEIASARRLGIDVQRTWMWLRLLGM